MSSLLEEGLMAIADDHLVQTNYEESLELYAKVCTAEAAFKEAEVSVIPSNISSCCFFYILKHTLQN